MPSKLERLKTAGKAHALPGIPAKADSPSALADRAAQAAAGVSARAAGAEPSVGTQKAVDTPVSGTGSQVTEIALDLIDDNPVNARVIYSPESLQSLAASIKLRGQEQPIRVVPNPQVAGRYISIFGHRRRRACALAGLRTVQALIGPAVPEQELFAASYAENNERDDHTALDDALAWRRVLDKGIFSSNAELAASIGQSEQVVGKTLAMLELPTPVLELVKTKPETFPKRIAYELVLIFRKVGETDTLSVASRIIDEQLSLRDVEKIKASLMEGATRKKKEVSRPYKLKSSEHMIEPVIKEWDDGRVAVNVQVADAKIRAALVRQLVTVLSPDEAENFGK